ncbi:MAG: Ig-like domain-containing protein [Myxococcota bacterium]
MRRLLVVWMSLSFPGCFFLPTEQYRCQADTDCLTVGGKCDLQSGTCLVFGSSVVPGTSPEEGSDASVVGGADAASRPDAAVRDAATPDSAVSLDGGPADAALDRDAAVMPDATVTPDAAMMPDATVMDAAVSSDAGARDAGDEDAAVVVVDAGPPPDAACPPPRQDGENSDPQARDDVSYGNEDTAIIVDVTANDCDPDGDPLVVRDVTGAGEREYIIIGNRVKYQPPANFVGTRTLRYLLSDEKGGSTLGTITLVFNAVNDPPTVTNAALQYAAPPLQGQLIALDPEGDPLTYVVVDEPDHGTLSLNATGGFDYVLAANDTAAYDSFAFRAIDDEGLQSAAGRVDIQLPVTAPNAYYTWQGGDPGNPTGWSVAANWSNNLVPNNFVSSVVIPDGQHQPVLSDASISVGTLTVMPGATLEVTSGVSLTVRNQAHAWGAITGAGTVVLNDNYATVAGTFPNLDIRASFLSLAGPTVVTGNLEVSNSSVALGGWTLEVTGHLDTSSAEILMSLDADTLVVHGNTNLVGGDSTGDLTAGTLEIHGDLFVTGKALVASGAHTTVFKGASRTLTMGFYEGALNHVRVEGSALTLVKPPDLPDPNAPPAQPGIIGVNGTLVVAGPTLVDGEDGMTLLVQGDLVTVPRSRIQVPVLVLQGPRGTALVEGDITSPVVELQGENSEIAPGVVYQELILHGRALVHDGTNVGTFRIQGTAGEAVIVGAVTVRDVLETVYSGALVMQSEQAYLKVLGSVALDGLQSPGEASQGTLEVLGNFDVGDNGFVASGQHRLILSGTALRQSVDITQGTNQNRVQDLIITNPQGVDFVSNVHVLGNLVVDCGTCTLTSSAARTTTVMGAFTTNAESSVSLATLALSSPRGTSDVAGAFTVDKLQMRADYQVIRTGLVCRELQVQADNVQTTGELILTGPMSMNGKRDGANISAALVLGGPLTASSVSVTGNSVLDTSGFLVTVTGNLTTDNGGRLETRESEDHVVVAGNARLHGNHADSAKTNGTLEVQGDLDLGDTFVPHADHEVIMNGTGATQDISVATGSRLANLRVAGTSRFLTSAEITGVLEVVDTATLVVEPGMTVQVPDGGTLILRTGSTLDNQGTVSAASCALETYTQIGTAPACP